MPKVLPAFLMLAALAGGACSQDGTVHVTWSFVGNVAAADGCGRNGVDSIVVSGASSGGDGMRTVGLCTPGWRDVGVAPGTWMVQVTMLDAKGNPIALAADAPSPTGTAVVTTDVPGSVSVQLGPASSQ